MSSSLTRKEMKRYGLDSYSFSKLKHIALEMGLKTRRSKESLILDINSAFDEYVKYKKDKLDRYKKIHQIGTKGKEGTTYLVKTKSGRKLAMKTFRKNKSSRTLIEEYEFLLQAGKEKISPKAKDYDTVSKYIVMTLLDQHLVDYLKKHSLKLYKYQQERIIHIYNTLDKLKIFHNDPNILNFMVSEKEIYIIDFGYAKKINEKFVKKYKTKTPNITIALPYLISELKKLNVPEESYKYLQRRVK